MTVRRRHFLILLGALLTPLPAFAKKNQPRGGDVKSFLYGFGYESPETRQRNQKFGDDAEESAAVFIIAKDEAAALAWGHEISEWFVRKLFGNPGESWTKGRFASWIEHDAAKISAAAKTKPPLPTVHAGEYPNFDQMRPRR